MPNVDNSGCTEDYGLDFKKKEMVILEKAMVITRLANDAVNDCRFEVPKGRTG